MAGSYLHATTVNKGKLLSPENMVQIATENQGDTYETIEEMYGMIWWLAKGDAGMVELARRHYLQGIKMSPGKQKE